MSIIKLKEVLAQERLDNSELTELAMSMHKCGYSINGF